MFNSRKFVLTLIGVGMVLFIGIGSALLKKYADLDVGEIAKWAMITVMSGVGVGSGAIAYEDAGKAKAAAKTQ